MTHSIIGKTVVHCPKAICLKFCSLDPFFWIFLQMQVNQRTMHYRWSRGKTWIKRNTAVQSVILSPLKNEPMENCFTRPATTKSPLN